MYNIHVSTTYPTGGTLLPNAFVDYYMMKANGEYIKVYIYLLRMVSNGTRFSISCLADVLELTERDIKRALKYWQKEGLLQLELSGDEISSIQILPLSIETTTTLNTTTSDQEEADHVAEIKISTSSEAAANDEAIAPQAVAIPAQRTLTPAQLKEKSEDETFSYLLYICETYLGRPLTSNDLNTLSYFYDDLSMSSELIEYLVDYCVSNGKKNFRYMQSVAIHWYQDGIRTVNDAKTNSQLFQKDYYTIMRTFGLNNNPAPAQIKYMKQWIDVDGFDISLIVEACNRTINAIGKPKFQYANSILKKWKDNHVVSLSDLKALDEKKGSPMRHPIDNQMHNFKQREYDFDALEKKFVEKVNHQKKEG